MNRFLVVLVLLYWGVISGQMEDSKAGDYLRDGITAMQAERYAEALTSIQKAIELDSENAELYRLEGQILEMLDRPDAARIAWELCFKFATDEVLKKEAAIHLQSLKE